MNFLVQACNQPQITSSKLPFVECGSNINLAFKAVLSCLVHSACTLSKDKSGTWTVVFTIVKLSKFYGALLQFHDTPQGLAQTSDSGLKYLIPSFTVSLIISGFQGPFSWCFSQIAFYVVHYSCRVIFLWTKE